MWSVPRAAMNSRIIDFNGNSSPMAKLCAIVFTVFLVIVPKVHGVKVNDGEIKTVNNDALNAKPTIADQLPVAFRWNRSINNESDGIELAPANGTSIRNLQFGKYNTEMALSMTPSNNHTNDTATTTDETSIDWTDLLLALLLCVLIVITVIGNTLVILAVLTTRRLRTVTNCFVMSLAVADWLVGIFVMPPAVAVYLVGSWQLGWIICNIWVSLDVLLCTASILSLCAISIDRYLAVTQPLNYSRRRRSKRLALVMILIVWTLALAITCPPILGWYDHSRKDKHNECGYNQNEGYVVFSAMGSFFIPMAVMVYVYARISCVVAARHEHMTEIEVHKKHNKHFDVELEADMELEPSSEQDSHSPFRKRQASTHHSMRLKADSSTERQRAPTPPKNGHYELVDSRIRSQNRATTKSKSSSASSSGSEHWSTKSVHQSHQFNAKQSQQQQQSNNVTAYEQCIVKQNTRTHHKSLSNRILSLKRENKTTQTLSIVVGGFIVCWLPFFICYLITPFLPSKSISSTLSTILTWLGWFNSAMNPFIYAFYSVDFRAAFWRLTLRRFFKNSAKAPYSSNVMSIKR